MILAFDSYYYADRAKTVCVVFQRWDDERCLSIYDDITPAAAEYEPGAFYKRELPCILSLLKRIPLRDERVEAIVIDGFVHLDDKGKYGLGGYLFAALGEKIPVVGVAKTDFGGISALKRAVLRGESKKPLYVTAAGMNLDDAARCILSMHGRYRFPTLLKMLDSLSKET